MGNEQWDESYHYMSSGEVMAVLALMKKFRERNVNLEYGTARQYPVPDLLNDRHIILIGSGRTNPLISELQQDCRFTLGELGVAENGHLHTYFKTDELEPSADSKRINKYAVLTRLRDSKRDRCVTIIAANHGRAAQGVVEDFITYEPNLEKLIAKIIADPTTDALPAYFQIVFRVAILKESGEARIQEVDPIVVDTVEN